MEAVLLFFVFCLAEVATAAIAGVITWHFGRGEMVDMLDALGIGGALAIGAVTIVLLEIGCYRRIGYAPVTLIGEVLC